MWFALHGSQPARYHISGWVYGTITGTTWVSYASVKYWVREPATSAAFHWSRQCSGARRLISSWTIGAHTDAGLHDTIPAPSHGAATRSRRPSRSPRLPPRLPPITPANR